MMTRINFVSKRSDEALATLETTFKKILPTIISLIYKVLSKQQLINGEKATRNLCFRVELR